MRPGFEERRDTTIIGNTDAGGIDHSDLRAEWNKESAEVRHTRWILWQSTPVVVVLSRDRRR
jgi:hypothetical protein